MNRHNWMMVAAVLAFGGAPAFAMGCGPAQGGFGGDGDGGIVNAGEDDDGGSVYGMDGSVSNGDGGATGLPCDVDALLKKYCASCHGVAPSSGIPLVSWADLQVKSKGDPNKNEAQQSLVRMQNNTMPPANQPKPTAAEMQTFAAWVNANTPMGNCGSSGPTDAGPNPFSGPHVCTSGQYYSSGQNTSMEPGNACVACHKQKGEGPLFSIAGTVYPTGHEPARCKAPAAAGAVVTITDKNGKKLNLTVNSVGNFSSTTTLTPPYTAVVTFQGRTRAMVGPQTNGDCNVCHTENGTNQAPGRILLP